MATSSGIAETVFPAGALVPKAETGALNFLRKYPDYNGRDVTIAIFDSGVDPRATGLETITDGKTVKVIERFDCTGCGDVDVSTVVSADKDGFITGLTGRKLKLTPQMISSSNGSYHIGIKTFYDLCPSKVRENIANANKLKEWDEANKIAIAERARQIASIEAQNPVTETSKLPWDKRMQKEDHESMIEWLNAYDKSYKDIKVTYDCIVYNTNDGFQVVIDLSEEGDLEKALHIGEYSKTHEVKNVDDYLSISVNVHDKGDTLEVVGMCSSHGTHVASIASGNHSSSDIDGLAPNAKIVSFTIGDGRLGSMETGTALVRAMTKVMEMCRGGQKIDVINMSYGEHSHWSNVGRIGELMSEVVNKYGVVWVASAGNHGPALCTIGTPPDISQPSCVGVGAYVSPQMMEAEYAMREKLPGNCYTWTSRDPCIDGGQGVTVCAPGGAITSVPQFTMSKSQLMNGTSMAAPHVAGAIALLISGLKQKGIPYSPFSIKRALCATATKLDYVDPFAQGSGLLNVEKAFEHLMEHGDAAENMLRFSVRCAQTAKGIHIREGVLRKPVEVNVAIEPIFFNDKEAAPQDKINFNVRLNLISTQQWVQCGAFLDLSYSARTIAVKVDPSGLPSGVHTAVIRAFDSKCVKKGSLFEIPVTVVQPHTLNCEETRTFEPLSSNKVDGSIEYHPNTITRDFILVPRQATWAVLRMRSTDKNRDKDVGKFFVHTMQLLPKSSCVMMETMKILAVNTETETTWAFRCQENNILELCIAKYWSCYGNTHLKYSLEFHGMQAISPNAFVMHAGRGIHKISVTALVCEELQPQLQLKTAAVVLKPTETKISPLSGTRDVIPDGRQIYQNLLTYTLHVPKAQEIALYAPIFNSVLYESEYESQLWMLFDLNKAMLACGDAHSHKFYTKLEKGEYTIKLQVRHEKRDMLEKVSEATMVAHFKLANPLPLDFYDHYNLSVTGGRKCNVAVVKDMPPKVLYIAPLPQEKLSKANLPTNCAWLGGSLTLAKDEAARRVDQNDFIYLLNVSDGAKKNGSNGSSTAAAAAASSSTAATSNAAKNKAAVATAAVSPSPSVTASGDGAATTATPPSTGVGSPKKSKSSADEYAEGLRDFKCTMITKCDLEKAEKIYAEVIAEHPKHLAAHCLLIGNIEQNEIKQPALPFAFNEAMCAMYAENVVEGEDAEKEGSGTRKIRSTLSRIIELADIVIKETDKDALLAFYGIKVDVRQDALKIKANMEKQRNTLIEAYCKKGIALAKQGCIDGQVDAFNEEIDSIHAEIMKYVDMTDSKVLVFSLWHAFSHFHFGRQYKLMLKHSDDKRNREHYEELALMAKSAELPHLQKVLKRLTVSGCPPGFRVF